MYQYYNNILCIEGGWLYNEGAVMSKFNYDRLVQRGHFEVLRRACKGTPALIAYRSIPERFKKVVEDILGSPNEQFKHREFMQSIVNDIQAAEFYRNYLLPTGKNISLARQRRYSAEASILNAIKGFVLQRKHKLRNLTCKNKGMWDLMVQVVAGIDTNTWPHELPNNPRSLERKYKQYITHGYNALIHGGFGNDNSRKVNERIKWLIMSIYCMENMPFGEWVHEYYLRFISGSLSIFDQTTGEMFNRNDFYDDKKQNYIEISRSTVWNILNDPANAVTIDRMRSSRIDHLTLKTPFNHRKRPCYSLSKISMDDRTLPRKTLTGEWVNAYYSFDVMSGVVLGYVHTAAKPNTEMVYDCFRSMYRFINNNKLMWPAEVEVENHLMKPIQPVLESMFTYVTFGNPGTSRSKRAEHLIREKKYGDEKKYQVGIGCWYGKGAYKTKNESKDPDYKQPRLPLELIIAEDVESIIRFNNSLHSRQDMFPGKTRMQVLIENVFPQLTGPVLHQLFKAIGYKTATSIRNNDYVRVQYENYGIDKFNAIANLKPNNYEVIAYYMPNTDGGIDNIYLYQEETFVCTASKIEAYQEAKVERTEKDEAIRLNQSKRQAQFHKMVKTEKENIIKIGIMENKPQYNEIVPVIVADNVVDEIDWEEVPATDYGLKALDY
jgi:hypothetical protein